VWLLPFLVFEETCESGVDLFRSKHIGKSSAVVGFMEEAATTLRASFGLCLASALTFKVTQRVFFDNQTNFFRRSSKVCDQQKILSSNLLRKWKWWFDMIGGNIYFDELKPY